MRIADDDADADDIGIAVLVRSSAAGAGGDAWRNVASSPGRHSVCAQRARTRLAICHAKTNSASAVPRILSPVVACA